MKREKKHVIKFEWFQVQADGSKADVLDRHADFLVETAMDRINDQVGKGFTSGELSDNIHSCDADGDGVSYSGSWSIEEVQDVKKQVFTVYSTDMSVLLDTIDVLTRSGDCVVLATNTSALYHDMPQASCTFSTAMSLDIFKQTVAGYAVNVCVEDSWYE